MGLFFYTKKGSIISTVDLPTTEIIEPKKGLSPFFRVKKSVSYFWESDVLKVLYI